jgi:hypothetical protein
LDNGRLIGHKSVVDISREELLFELGRVLGAVSGALDLLIFLDDAELACEFQHSVDELFRSAVARHFDVLNTRH